MKINKLALLLLPILTLTSCGGKTLTEEETKEREVLRNEYRASFRMGLSDILDNTVIQYPDGTKIPVKRKHNAKC